MVKYRMVVLNKSEKIDADELEPGCCKLLLERWWARERKLI
jgi:hypothetical protein